MQHGGNRRLGAIAVVVAAVVVVIGGGYALHRQSTTVSQAGQVIGFTPPPTERPRPLVLFVGDSWTSGAKPGGNFAANYSAIVGKHFGWDSQPIATGGTGYLAGGGGSKTDTFASPDRLARVARWKTPHILFLVNGINDLGKTVAQAEQRLPLIGPAVQRTIAVYRKADPGSKIVVIGYVPPGDTSDLFARADQIIGQAAKAAGATFWDPAAEHWFGGEHKSLIGFDHFHPTDAGHRYLAELIERHVSAAGLTLAGLSGPLR